VAELRAVDVLPIDVASKLALGVTETVKRVRSEAVRGAAAARHEWARLRLWADRQHLNPDQVLQLAVLVVYGLVAVAEAVAYRRKGR
jgi:hypothetical protein